MSGHDSILADALSAERRRAGVQVARVRLYVLTVFGAFTSFFWFLDHNWIGPMVPLGIHWILSCVLFAVSRVTPDSAWVNRYAVPFIDSPMLLWSLLDNNMQLAAAGYAIDAEAMRYGGSAFFIVLIAVSSLSLDPAVVLFTGVAVTLCQLVMAFTKGPNVTLTIFILLSMATTALVGRLTIGRTLGLVGAVSGERAKRERLGRYFPPQVIDHVEQGADELAAGEAREVSVLFCDIRGFTALAESLPSHGVVAMLNEFLEAMTEVVFAHGGTLDKFTGDGLMAYFGAPVSKLDHAADAVRCALAMQERVARLNEARAARGDTAIQVGIGVHAGPVVLGDIGSPHRRDFTAIGDVVNVASRIEGLTKDVGVPVLVSDSVRAAAASAAEYETAGALEVRGRSEAMTCFVPTAIAAEAVEP